MVTGFDSVVAARAPVAPGLRTMLDRVQLLWPGMVVAVGDPGSSAMEPFRPWRRVRPGTSAETGELYVARDAAMERHWDDAGYVLTADGTGPFALLYGPVPAAELTMRTDEDPYGPRAIRYEPYPMTLITAGLSLISLVTPDEDSPFSRRLRELLVQALRERAG